MQFSCNHADMPSAKGSYSITDSEGNVLEKASLSWGGYYYDESDDAYDIVLNEHDYFYA